MVHVITSMKTTELSGEAALVHAARLIEAAAVRGTPATVRVNRDGSRVTVLVDGERVVYLTNVSDTPDYLK